MINLHQACTSSHAILHTRMVKTMSKGKLKKHPYLPKKRPAQSEEQIDGGIAGLAWYTPESYARLLEVSADRQQRHATYAEWYESATDALINLQLMGVPVEK